MITDLIGVIGGELQVTGAFAKALRNTRGPSLHIQVQTLQVAWRAFDFRNSVTLTVNTLCFNLSYPNL